MRNSSLVEWSCAENVPGLKPAAEVVDVSLSRYVVEERRMLAEAVPKGAVDGIRERMPA